MKAVIIEDETAAARNLKMLLASAHPNIDIQATIESVAEAAEWFANNPTPDIVFMDIHLADGNAFRLFENTSVECPIIFTTAYDQYALDAFKVNGIDYLLKPIKPDELNRAIKKMLSLTASAKSGYAERVGKAAQTSRRRTLLAQMKDRLIPIAEDDIAFFYTSNERVSVTTLAGKCYPVDGTLEGLFGEYGGHDFFRANRQFIISRRAVKDMSVWFGSRIVVNLTLPTPERIVVSKARASEFKDWLLN